MVERRKFNLGRVLPNARDEGAADEGAAVHSGSSAAGASVAIMEPGLTQKSDLRRTSSVRSFSLMMLSSGQNQINVLRTSLNELHENVRYRYVLHPLSKYKTAWDIISAAAVLYYSWMIPFVLCFDWYMPSAETKFILHVLDGWAIADILLRFRTGIIQYGAVVMNPREIRMAYVKSVWFPLDLVSSIPYERLFPQSSTVTTRKTIKMIKYIKLPKLLRIGRYFKFMKRYRRYSSSLITLSTVLFASHVAGCVWVAVLRPCDAEDLTQQPLCADGMEMNVYWICLEHGVVTLLGISVDHVESAERFLSGGYQNENQILSKYIYLWATTVSILGTVLTAVLYGTIIHLVQSWNRAENAFRKKLDHITHEMDALSLPHHIRTRVNAYYDYLWINSRMFSNDLDILKDSGMSLALRQQIAIYLFKDYLQKIPFFQLATDAVLGMICMQLQQVIYMPDDYIIREGDIGKELFMIVKGIVRVMPPVNEPQPSSDGTDAPGGGVEASPAPKKILLGEGDFFGEIGVVMEVERTRSVKAECMAELCILMREGFEKILVEFPEFATAMKRLIIKRVGEMWQGDEKASESIEKMTRLTDWKMKKTMNAHKNVQKLRGAAHMLTIQPRLSKLVKHAAMLTGHGGSQRDLPEISSLPPVVVIDAAVSEHSLDTIEEQESAGEVEETTYKTTAPSPAAPSEAMSPSELREMNKTITNTADAWMGKSASAGHLPVVQRPPTPTPAVMGTTGEPDLAEDPKSTGTRREHRLQRQLQQLESRMEDRMLQLDAKLSQLLACVTTNGLATIANGGGGTRPGILAEDLSRVASGRHRSGRHHRAHHAQQPQPPQHEIDVIDNAARLIGEQAWQANGTSELPRHWPHEETTTGGRVED